MRSVKKPFKQSYVLHSFQHFENISNQSNAPQILADYFQDRFAPFTREKPRVRPLVPKDLPDKITR